MGRSSNVSVIERTYYQQLKETNYDEPRYEQLLSKKEVLFYWDKSSSTRIVEIMRNFQKEDGDFILTVETLKELNNQLKFLSKKQLNDLIKIIKNERYYLIFYTG